MSDTAPEWSFTAGAYFWRSLQQAVQSHGVKDGDVIRVHQVGSEGYADFDVTVSEPDENGVVTVTIRERLP